MQLMWNFFSLTEYFDQVTSSSADQNLSPRLLSRRDFALQVISFGKRAVCFTKWLYTGHRCNSIFCDSALCQ